MRGAAVSKFIVCLCITLAAGLSFAEEKLKPAPLNAEAVEIVRNAMEFLRKQKSYTTALTHTSKISGAPQYNKEYAFKYDVAAAAPNKLRFAITGGDPRCAVYSDGLTICKVAPALKVYSLQAAPKTLAEVFSISEFQFIREDLSALLFLDFFAMPEGLDIILKDVEKVKLYGVEKIGDVKAYHLHFSEKDFEWDMWIQEGTHPFLRRISFQGEQTKKEENIKLTKLTQTEFDKWKLNEEYPIEHFVFSPPADVKKVDSFIDEPYDPKLLGEPAPQFVGKLMEGAGTFDLSKARDKQPVLLQFWATWCGPCRKSMPIVSEICEQYRAKGVASYAVNLKEPFDKVKEYKLDASSFTIPIILDEDGNIAKSYRVQPIPMVVLIGKSGLVEAVWLGLPNNLVEFKAKLKQQLDTLIEGKSLLKGAK